MRIEIERDADIVFPGLCPCCSRAADTTDSIEGSQPMGTATIKVRVDMPICNACLAHRKVGQRLALRVVFAGTVLLALGLGLDFAGNPRRGSLLYMLAELLAMLFVASLLAAPVAYVWDRIRWSRTNPDHAAVGNAVRLYWTAFGTGFDFKNETYAEQFRTLNAKRLVQFSWTEQPK